MHLVVLLIWILAIMVLLIYAEDRVEMFYINLKRSTGRDVEMQKHLKRMGYPYQRIEAVEISQDINYNISKAIFPCKENIEPFVLDVPFYKSNSLKINRLCISEINNLKEIACTLSHIKAVLAALSSSNTNDYAMILEDDMMIAFDVDFKELGNRLPHDFGVLQVFTKNYKDSGLFADKYDAEGLLYVPWKPHHWSTGGYLINKKVLRNTFASLLTQTNSNVLEMDFISADNVTKTPSYCFDNENNILPQYPCVLSRFDVIDHGLLGGIAADYYMYCLTYGKTYTITIPLIKANNQAYQSTITNNYAAESRHSIDTARLAILDIYWGNMKPPPYVQLYSFEIFYINHPNAVKGRFRDKEIREHLYRLGHPYQRVEAVTIKSINLDRWIENATYPCDRPVHPITFTSSILGSKNVRINSLCLSPENNRYDLAKMISHIKAILQVLSSSNTYPYALVMEDDMMLIEDSIDIEAFIDQIPPDFVAIQVSMLARHSLSDAMLDVVADGTVFIDWEHQYSNGRGYILNRKTLMQGFYESGLLTQKGKETFELDVIALKVRLAETGPPQCFPSWCCNSFGLTVKRYPCVPSDRGISTHSFIFSMLSLFGDVYISPAPFVVSNPNLCTRGDWFCKVLRRNNLELKKAYSRT